MISRFGREEAAAPSPHRADRLDGYFTMIDSGPTVVEPPRLDVTVTVCGTMKTPKLSGTARTPVVLNSQQGSRVGQVASAAPVTGESCTRLIATGTGASSNVTGVKER